MKIYRLFGIILISIYASSSVLAMKTKQKWKIKDWLSTPQAKRLHTSTNRTPTKPYAIKPNPPLKRSNRKQKMEILAQSLTSEKSEIIIPSPAPLPFGPQEPVIISPQSGTPQPAVPIFLKSRLKRSAKALGSHTMTDSTCKKTNAQKYGEVKFDAQTMGAETKEITYYLCQIDGCKKTEFWPSYLIKHRISSHCPFEDLPFECLECDMSLNPYRITNHINTKHPGKNRDEIIKQRPPSETYLKILNAPIILTNAQGVPCQTPRIAPPAIKNGAEQKQLMSDLFGEAFDQESVPALQVPTTPAIELKQTTLGCELTEIDLQSLLDHEITDADLDEV